MTRHGLRWGLLLLTVPVAIGACGTDRELLSGAGATSSEFQNAILSDGEVAVSEYERAVYATVSCLEDAGVKVTGPAWTLDGTYFTYTYRSQDSSTTAIDQRCVDEYLDAVQQEYVAQNRPSEAELLDEITAFASCLRDAGVADAQDGIDVVELERLAVDAGQLGRCPSPNTIIFPPELVSGSSQDE